MKKRINNYLDYIIARGINLKPNGAVEIVTSSYIPEILDMLISRLKKYNPSVIKITFIDGDTLQEEINRDWRGFLDKRISEYNSLIKLGFSRITLLSPFLFPVCRTNSVDLYKAHLNELSFVANYFYNGYGRHTTAAISNLYWAARLELSNDELWDKILSLYKIDNELLGLKDFLNSLKIRELSFKTGLGTNLRVGLINEAKLLGRTWYDRYGNEYEPNIPSLEIYTSPNKYRIDGIMVSSRPLFYKNKLIKDYSLEFKDGRVVANRGLDDILCLDKGLEYVGEIALAITRDDKIYYNTLLDENLGCHLALGCGFLNEIKSPLVNEAGLHIDLVFGTKDIDITLICDDKEIPLFKNGRLEGVKLC